MKREADFGLLFRHWLRSNPMPSGAYELKQTTGNSLPFSDVQDHQIDALRASKSPQGLFYKAPDDSRSTKPFDYFHLRNSLAWVVIRYPSSFHIIDVDAFVLEDGRSIRRSLTCERARAISTISVDL